METLYLLLLFPLVWPWIAKLIFKDTINWQEMGINIVVVCLVVSAVFFIGRAGKISDTELWSGQITKKNVKTGSYVRSYECMCVTMSCGKNCSTTVCQTCYEDRYTKNWWLNSTLGDIGIRSRDTTSKSVWNEADPPLYKKAYVGEPCSKYNSFDNYVAAVENSLFNDQDHITAYQEYEGLFPSYPKITDLYQVNRVIRSGIVLSDTGIEKFQDDHKEMNTGIGNMLRSLGHDKQVNIIMAWVNTNDPNYRYGLESHWAGGKKNDVVIMMGITEYPKVEWIDVMTFGGNIGNELLRTVLRDSLVQVGEVDPQRMLPIIEATVRENYARPEMSQFEYLKAEVQPGPWALGIAIFFAIFGSIGLTYLFHVHDVDFFANRRRSGRGY